MMLTLIEIGENGRVESHMPLPDPARPVCEAMAGLYRQAGFVRPWTGYLAEQAGEIVGTCAFKSPPADGSVEIAYFTFPPHEGRGIATAMARELVRIARAHDQGIGISAQTLPRENASTAVLRKLGFRRVATVEHPEDGTVWEWRLGPL